VIGRQGRLSCKRCAGIGFPVRLLFPNGHRKEEADAWETMCDTGWVGLFGCCVWSG